MVWGKIYNGGALIYRYIMSHSDSTHGFDWLTDDVARLLAKLTIWVGGALAGGVFGSVALYTPNYYNAPLAVALVVAAVLSMALGEYARMRIER